MGANRKQPEERFGAGLPNYEKYINAFSWTQAQALLDGLPAGGSISRMRRSTVIYWRAAAASSPCAGSAETIVSRITPIPRGRGNQPVCQRFGPARRRQRRRVFSLLGRVPELYFAALGTLKNGSVFSPLFSAFGPEPIKARMSIGDAKALITSEAFYRRKIEPWRKNSQASANLLDRLLALPRRAQSASRPPWQQHRNRLRRVDRPRRHGLAALYQRHYRTAEGRGARARSRRCSSYHWQARARSHPDDVFWCTADPGWVTGTSTASSRR